MANSTSLTNSKSAPTLSIRPLSAAQPPATPTPRRRRRCTRRRTAPPERRGRNPVARRRPALIAATALAFAAPAFAEPAPPGVEAVLRAITQELVDAVAP